MEKKKVTSVFDIIGRTPITPSQQHFNVMFNLGHMLRSLLPTPITSVVFDLDHGVRQSSLTSELQTAFVAGAAGLSSLDEDKNIYQYAYQEGMSVAFVPNSTELERPHTTLVTVKTSDYSLILELTTDREHDQLALTEINGHTIAVDLATQTRLFTLTLDGTLLRNLASSEQLAMRVESGQAIADGVSLMILAADDLHDITQSLHSIPAVLGVGAYITPAE